MAIKSVPLGGAFEHNYDPRGRQFGRTKLKKFNFPTSFGTEASNWSTHYRRLFSLRAGTRVWVSSYGYSRLLKHQLPFTENSYWNLCHYSAIKHPMNEFSSKTKIRVIIFTTNWHWGGIDIFPHQVDNSVTGLWVVMVIWLFYLPERYSVFFLQSSMSISAVPEITSSSSRASKRLTKLASNTFGKKWRHVMIHPEKRVIKHAIIIVYMI